MERCPCFIGYFFLIFLVLVLDYWCCLPWVSKAEWIPHLCASLPKCNGFLRFTSGATPALMAIEHSPDSVYLEIAADSRQLLYNRDVVLSQVICRSESGQHE